MPSIRDDSGMTLTELLVVTVLISVIIAASYFMFTAAQSMNDIAMARSSATDDAQSAIDKMTREFRQTQVDRTPDENPVGGVFKLANANEAIFMSDLNDDQVPELVRYYVEGGSLKRTVAPAPTRRRRSRSARTLRRRSSSRSSARLHNPIFCYHTERAIRPPCCAARTEHWLRQGAHERGPIQHDARRSPWSESLLNVPGTSGSKTVTVTTRALVRMRTVDNEVE